MRCILKAQLHGIQEIFHGQAYWRLFGGEAAHIDQEEQGKQGGGARKETSLRSSLLEAVLTWIGFRFEFVLRKNLWLSNFERRSPFEVTVLIQDNGSKHQEWVAFPQNKMCSALCGWSSSRHQLISNHVFFWQTESRKGKQVHLFFIYIYIIQGRF